MDNSIDVYGTNAQTKSTSGDRIACPFMPVQTKCHSNPMSCKCKQTPKMNVNKRPDGICSIRKKKQ